VENYLNGVESPAYCCFWMIRKRRRCPMWQHDLSRSRRDWLIPGLALTSLTLTTGGRGVGVRAGKVPNRMTFCLASRSGRSRSTRDWQMEGLLSTPCLAVRLNAGSVFDVLVQISSRSIANAQYIISGDFTPFSERQDSPHFRSFVFENYPLDRSMLTRSFDGIQIGRAAA